MTPVELCERRHALAGAVAWLYNPPDSHPLVVEWYGAIQAWYALSPEEQREGERALAAWHSCSGLMTSCPLGRAAAQAYPDAAEAVRAARRVERASVRRAAEERLQRLVRDYGVRAPAREPDGALVDRLETCLEDALRFLIARQTSDERASETTIHRNDLGFDATDGALVRWASVVESGGTVATGLRRPLAARLAKYRGQLGDVLARVA